MHMGYIEIASLKLNYIDNGVERFNKVPLLICPGLSEECTDYLGLVNEISDRRCIALTFRGRGKSCNEIDSYTLENHIEDIESVVNELKLDKFCLMGYSRGVSYVLGYSILNPNKLSGLILGEYPAEHKRMHNGWAKEQMGVYESHDIPISITYDVLKKIERDSRYEDFSINLNKIKCPALILKGLEEDTLLPEVEINRYINNLGGNSIRIEKFSKSGHDIISNEFHEIVLAIQNFLYYIDTTNS